MLCPRCGHSVKNGLSTCPECGTMIRQESRVSGETVSPYDLRQGRSSRIPNASPEARNASDDQETPEYGDYDLSSVPMVHEQGNPRENRKKAIRMQEIGERDMDRVLEQRGQKYSGYSKKKPVYAKNQRSRSSALERRMKNINWTLIAIILVVVGGITGGVLYMRHQKSDSGQQAIARRNTLAVVERDFEIAADWRTIEIQEDRKDLLDRWGKATPDSYWIVGQDFAAVGDIETAILAYRIADILDPENYSGLMLMATAYEMNAQHKEAEDLYVRLSTQMDPANSEAHTALINLLLSEGREPEAASAMLTAYNRTGRESYRQQRNNLIPKMPQTSMTAGRYQIDKLSAKVALISPDGYDMYYTTDDNAVLPQDGILCTDGIINPEEGTIHLRAVCVAGNLVSDMLSVTYTFYYPTPPAPQANLAPNTYNKLKTVNLRAGNNTDERLTKKEVREYEKHYRYFYTVDGSTPTENSPEYTGEPIRLPSGRVTLKAICINQYNKSSSALEIGYKFDVKPFPLERYTEADTFGGFVLNRTSRTEFEQTFGEPKKESATTYLYAGGEAIHAEYPWGYAVFLLQNNAWSVVRVEMNRSITTCPRNVGFGASETEVCAAYRDCGQPPNQDSSRGLYYDYPEVGQVLLKENDQRVVQYQCQTAAGRNWYLQYWLTNGQVTKIVNYYQP